MLGSMLGAGERAGMEQQPSGEDGLELAIIGEEYLGDWWGGGAGSGTSPGTVWGRGKLSDEGR